LKLLQNTIKPIKPKFNNILAWRLSNVKSAASLASVELGIIK
jgi:hypothetical protein